MIAQSEFSNRFHVLVFRVQHDVRLQPLASLVFVSVTLPTIVLLQPVQDHLPFAEVDGDLVLLFLIVRVLKGLVAVALKVLFTIIIGMQLPCLLAEQVTVLVCVVSVAHLVLAIVRILHVEVIAQITFVVVGSGILLSFLAHALGGSLLL